MRLTEVLNRLNGRLAAKAGSLGVIETTGRRTRRPRTASIGFVDLDDGAFVVLATDPERHWAANLAADPVCRFTTRGETHTYRAHELTGEAAGRAVERYGRRYGAMPGLHGPVFELRRVS